MTKRHEKLTNENIQKILFSFFINIFQELPFSCFLLVFFFFFLNLFYFPKMSNIILNITYLVPQDQSFYSFFIRNYLNPFKGPLYHPCSEFIITSLWLSFDLPSKPPGESHNEWYQYYCSNFYVFKLHLEQSYELCKKTQLHICSNLYTYSILFIFFYMCTYSIHIFYNIVNSDQLASSEAS